MKNTVGLIKSQQIDFAIEGHPDVLKDIVESLHEAYQSAGMDMPKRLHDAVFEIECQLEDEITETICCDRCGHEYDRHIGDECPNCGHNNHEQYERKYS